MKELLSTETTLCGPVGYCATVKGKTAAIINAAIIIAVLAILFSLTIKSVRSM